VRRLHFATELLSEAGVWRCSVSQGHTTTRTRSPVVNDIFTVSQKKDSQQSKTFIKMRIGIGPRAQTNAMPPCPGQSSISTFVSVDFGCKTLVLSYYEAELCFVNSIA